MNAEAEVTQRKDAESQHESREESTGKRDRAEAAEGGRRAYVDPTLPGFLCVICAVYPLTTAPAYPETTEGSSQAPGKLTEDAEGGRRAYVDPTLPGFLCVIRAVLRPRQAQFYAEASYFQFLFYLISVRFVSRWPSPILVPCSLGVPP